MRVSKEFCEYKPWEGAVDTMDKVEEAGKLEELEHLLEDIFGECPEETTINDFLWFQGDQVLEMLGISNEDEEE